MLSSRESLFFSPPNCGGKTVLFVNLVSVYIINENFLAKDGMVMAVAPLAWGEWVTHGPDGQAQHPGQQEGA